MRAWCRRAAPERSTRCPALTPQLTQVLWGKIDPTQADGQGNDWGTQYRTGIYYHDEEQKATALASRAAEEKKIGRTIMTEVLPATQWYDAEKYHQQYLAKGGRGGNAQSAAKGCKDPIRCGTSPDRRTLCPRRSRPINRTGATGKPREGR